MNYRNEAHFNAVWGDTESFVHQPPRATPVAKPAPVRQHRLLGLAALLLSVASVVALGASLIALFIK